MLDQREELQKFAATYNKYMKDDFMEIKDLSNGGKALLINDEVITFGTCNHVGRRVWKILRENGLLWM